MKAIILAAGQGTRLKPLTNHLPKCLVQVHGKPILQYQLEALDRAGIQNCIIIVGYLGQQVQHQFGPRFGDVRLTYITNERFQHTNNLYSLWVARKELATDILLLEGDILFEEGLIKDIVQSSHKDIAVVDRFKPYMDGTVILANEGVTKSMTMKSDQSTDFDYQNALKTVNIYSLSQDTMQHYFLPTLDHYVDLGLTDQFYEAVMAQLVYQGDLRMAIHLTGARWWAEIDTEKDLRHAELIFVKTSGNKYDNSIGSRVDEEANRESTQTWIR